MPQAVRDEPPAAWIFQAAASEYDLWGAIHAFSEDVWLARASQGALSMRPGQRAYFWKAGMLGGLFAVGDILELPAEKPAPQEQLRFWPAGSREAAEQPELRVRVSYTRRLPKGAITRATLRADPILSRQRPIAPVHVGTNFRVSAESDQRLCELVAAVRP